MPVHWKIEMLGGLSVSDGKTIINRFATQKVAGLLAFLALRRGRDIARDEIAALFWPESDTLQSRVSLRTALASLRKILEPDGTAPNSVLVADRLTVRLHSEAVETDVIAFEQTLARASRTSNPSDKFVLLREGLSLYKGDLLPLFYEDWALTERQRLSEMRLQALQQLAAQEAERGDLVAAADHLRSIVQAKPLDETGHQTLVRCLLRAGQMTAARRQYEDMEQMLVAELGITPSRSFESMVTEARTANEKVRVSAPTDNASPSVARTSDAVDGAHDRFRFLPPLPLSLTPFFGRQEEIERLLLILQDPQVRLISLTGLGGFGKTRLVLEVARHLREEGKPVCFVALAGVTEARLLGDMLCQSLGIPPVTGIDPLEHAIRFLQDFEERFYVTLDNLEQLIPDCLTAIERLLTGVPRIVCLTTSRMPLDLSYEIEYPVAPLPTPHTPATAERLMDFASVRLFAYRAKAVRPDFQVTSANAPAVARLCHALDGIPLALELAASRSSLLTPEQMIHHIADRFGFLAGRSRDIAERQRTLRAVLDWSCQALTDEQRKLFGQLSVFQGSWSLEAVRQVCEEPQALDLLTDFRHLSLLWAGEQIGEMRYRLLETVREYAAGLLDVESRESLAARHLTFYTGIAEAEEKHMRTPEQGRAVARMEQEYDNIRFALHWALKNDGRAALRLARAPIWFWQCRGYVSDGLQMCRAAAAHPEAQESSDIRADVLNGIGVMLYLSGDPPAAERPISEALAISRAQNYERGIADALNLLGMMAFGVRDFERARPILEEAHDLGCLSGCRWYVAPTYLCVIYYGLGDTERAFRVIEGLRRDAGRVNSIWLTMAAHLMAGILHSEEGNLTESSRQLEDSLVHAASAGDRLGIAYVTREMAILAWQNGDDRTAASLFGSLNAMMTRMGTMAILPFRKYEHTYFADQVKTRLGEETFTACWTVGQAMTWDESIAFMHAASNK